VRQFLFLQKPPDIVAQISSTFNALAQKFPCVMLNVSTEQKINVAETMSTSDYPLRIGLGHDTHRLMEGTEITLGGVRFPFDFSLAGHSDADVLLHAITDALLGAAAIGDIGDLFPDTDPANRGRNSVEMLQIA
jgi:hypothetical protein